MSRPTTRRARQASEPRRDILDAAPRLFAERGYGRTALTDIAAEAGVGVPALYTRRGAKSVILRQLLDRIDELAGVAESAARLRMETDPSVVLSLAVSITRRIAEHSGEVIRVLASAATVEPEMAEAYAAGLAKHRRGAEL